nr:unnamed protein product [Callosobruchus chinensis]
MTNACTVVKGMMLRIRFFSALGEKPKDRASTSGLTSRSTQLTYERNTTHRHQPRNSDLFKFFRGRTPGLIAWAVAMNKPVCCMMNPYISD